MMQLAFYKGPAADRRHQLAHRLICLFTGSKYSHVELIINGTACSASARDGGVRVKQIDLTSGKWDVIEIGGDEAAAWDWFATHAGQGYDWAGVARFIVPFLPHKRDQWFCSEAVAASLGFASSAADWTPGELADFYTDPLEPTT